MADDERLLQGNFNMRIFYKYYLFLTLLLTGSLYASQNILEFEIVPFDYADHISGSSEHNEFMKNFWNAQSNQYAHDITSSVQLGAFPFESDFSDLNVWSFSQGVGSSSSSLQLNFNDESSDRNNIKPVYELTDFGRSLLQQIIVQEKEAEEQKMYTLDDIE